MNETRGRVVGERVRVGDRWYSRARGFLGRPAPGLGEGMILRPCRAVHMFGVPYPLDVAFLDAEDEVVALYPELRPWRWTRAHARATAAVELPAGTLRQSGTRVGDRLVASTTQE